MCDFWNLLLASFIFLTLVFHCINSNLFMHFPVGWQACFQFYEWYSSEHSLMCLLGPNSGYFSIYLHHSNISGTQVRYTVNFTMESETLASCVYQVTFPPAWWHSHYFTSSPMFNTVQTCFCFCQSKGHEFSLSSVLFFILTWLLVRWCFLSLTDS